MTNAIVIGAGPAGLAVSAALKAKDVDVIVLEKGDQIASSWHRHYDRLHLHTPAKTSALPGLKFPDSVGRYPSRRDVITYMNSYAIAHGISPSFNVDVSDVSQTKSGWRVRHKHGEEHGDVVVFATGLADRPNRPDFVGLNSFPGQVIHSSEYRRPTDISGARVLVVGFGNSGGEIALDLAEAGKLVSMAVRSPVQILPRELLGVPITSFGLLQKIFPYKTVDAINAPILRLALGDYTRFGLQRAKRGPLAMIKETGRIPLMDIGTLEWMRRGEIRVVGGIQSFELDQVRFERGGSAPFDSVVLATGYRPRLVEMLGSVGGVLDPNGRPLVCGGATAAKGLYFCSYHASANGQLRQTGIEALAIAEAIAS